MDEGNGKYDIMLLHQVLHLTRYCAERQLNRMGLKPGQVGILFTLLQEDGQTGRQLAKKVGITPPSMTVALQKIENMGYVFKEADDHDQRRVRVYLTEKGRCCTRELDQFMNEMDRIIYRGFSESEKILLKRLLLTMRDNLLEVEEFEGINVCEIMKRTRKESLT